MVGRLIQIVNLCNREPSCCFAWKSSNRTIKSQVRCAFRLWQWFHTDCSSVSTTFCNIVVLNKRVRDKRKEIFSTSKKSVVGEVCYGHLHILFFTKLETEAENITLRGRAFKPDGHQLHLDQGSCWWPQFPVHRKYLRLVLQQRCS